MKVGIISDVHDAIWTLRAALEALQDTDALLVAGDLCSPFVLPILAEGFGGGQVHVVFGNNDGDRYRMALVARGLDRLTLHGEAFAGELGGRTFAMNHFPDLAEPVDPRRYDVIVYGHDHRYRVAREGAWRLNPGSLLGYDPAARADVPPTFLVYDTDQDVVDGFELRREGDAAPAPWRAVRRAAAGASDS